MFASLLITLTLGLVGHCELLADDPPEEYLGVCNNHVLADVIFLLDSSTSIGQSIWQEVVKFAASLTKRFHLGDDDVLFGGLIFNRSPTKIFDLYRLLNRALPETILAISYPNIQGSNTHLGLSKIRNKDLFRAELGGRLDARDYVIVVTDGLSSYPNKTEIEAQLLKDSGVTVFVVGVGAVNMKELAALATRKEFIFTARDFDQLENVKKDLVQLICLGDK